MEEDKIKNIELIISKIDELLEKDALEDNFEDCIKLKSITPDLKEFLSGNKTYEEVKNSVEFANSKISNILPKELKSE